MYLHAMESTLRTTGSLSDAVQSAQRTLATETAGLASLGEALAGSISEAFTAAVFRIGDIGGRVIVTGVGKSGHIGAKIAATLASTGTPAFFVHATEANHGDLGMIARDDAVLALSWSGETGELKGIVSYTRRFAIPLIAVTSNPQSALGAAADICLTLPKVQEACPHNLAPTTSTLMQMAMGDCLAVALLEQRGFSARDFHTFHPGGSLGAALVHAGEIMRRGDEMPLIGRSRPLLEAVAEISAKGFGCVAIVEDSNPAMLGILAGIITDGDLRRNLHRDMTSLRAEDIMTANPRTASIDTLAGTAMGELNKGPKGITALIVTDEDNRPVGLLRMHDLLRIGVA